MRKAPPSPPADVKRRAENAETRAYRFLTYVMGGGVRIREHQKLSDPVTPVRAASIRGQLRFWWRVCNPSRCKTVEELRAREAAIWGATSQASRVITEVIEFPPFPKTVDVYEYNSKGNIVPCLGMGEIAYGAFPLQPNQDAKKRHEEAGKLFDFGTSQFSVRFTYPEHLQEDVQAALWAWETFGGLGGRTRRGFGAIQRIGTPGELPSRIEAELSKYSGNPRLAHVPSLAGHYFAVARDTSQNALKAWKDGLEILHRIRQKPGFGRVKSSNPRNPGRSLWPEPDEIRRRTGAASPSHKSPHVAVERFPRAAFGMPIVFHFKDKDKGDPAMKPLHVQPADAERWASPLIIRPIPADNRFRTAALVLASDRPRAVLVAKEERFDIECDLDEGLAAQIPALQRGNKIFTDPIQLFLAELKR